MECYFGRSEALDKAIQRHIKIKNLYYKRAQLSEQNSPLVEASCQRAGGQMT